jgi:hypothetical protein
MLEESSDAPPIVIDSTGIALDESGQPLPPLTPAPEPEAPRTDFYFPPLPRTPAGKSDTPAPGAPQLAPRQSQVWADLRGLLVVGLRGLNALLVLCLRATWRGMRALGRGTRTGAGGLAQWSQRQGRRWMLPGLKAGWHWVVDDPYAPTRESSKQSLIQGRVLGVYRYPLYQRILVGVFGSLPLGVISIYLLNALISTIHAGVNDWLFWLQDVAGTLTGLFGCLIFLRLMSTRITLHSDGIEYKTWFRVVRSRWEEIAMLKVEYFRRNERWVVSTGRGSWAFLHRSVLGLPRGRQLSKLITIYARLNSTGTPYWLPAVGRYKEHITGEIHLPQERARRPRTPAKA